VDDRPPPFPQFELENTQSGAPISNSRMSRHSQADSMDTIADSQESDAALLPTPRAGAVDPRGEAPAYFEVVAPEGRRQAGYAS